MHPKLIMQSEIDLRVVDSWQLKVTARLISSVTISIVITEISTAVRSVQHSLHFCFCCLLLHPCKSITLLLNYSWAVQEYNWLPTVSVSPLSKLFTEFSSIVDKSTSVWYEYGQKSTHSTFDDVKDPTWHTSRCSCDHRWSQNSFDESEKGRIERLQSRSASFCSFEGIDAWNRQRMITINCRSYWFLRRNILWTDKYYGQS